MVVVILHHGPRIGVRYTTVGENLYMLNVHASSETVVHQGNAVYIKQKSECIKHPQWLHLCMQR